MKIGIVGSRAFKNKNQMKAAIEKCIEHIGSKNFTIVSGGCPDGGDALAKELALEMEIDYKEFPPAHAKHNQYCVLSEEHYNKPYQVANYFIRNGQIAEHVDSLMAFIVENVKANGTMDTVNKARNLGKNVVIIKSTK